MSTTTHGLLTASILLMLGMVLGLCLGNLIVSKREHRELGQKIDKCLVQVEVAAQVVQEGEKE